MTHEELTDFVRSKTERTGNATAALTQLINNDLCIITYRHRNINDTLEDLVSGAMVTGGLGFITMFNPSGLSGARSRKIVNIGINWKKLFSEGLDGYVSIAGAIATPSLIPLAALAICIKLYRLSDIEIDERHAMVLAALWKIKESNADVVRGSDIQTRIDPHFVALNRPELTRDEYDHLINDLDRLKTIRMNGDGSIGLVEKIKEAV